MLPSGSVRVLTVSTETPSPGTTPTQPLKLTFFDNFWLFLPPIQRVLFYDIDNPHFPTLVRKLRESLSLALRHFYPLAGKLTLSPESDELEIRLSDLDKGVLFVEAESDADFRRLVGESVHDVDTYRKLVPCLDVSELPAPLLSVQVTRFLGGGVCVGISAHHVAMDGRAFWHFIKSWHEICRSGNLIQHPSHDRSAIGDPQGLAKLFLDGYRPSLPKVPLLKVDSTDVVRQTFLLSSANIQLLKEKAGRQQSEPSPRPVSTFVAVSAHAWVCFVRARRLDQKENTAFGFLVDCRHLLNTPLPEEYFGNCVKVCFVRATGFELLGEIGFGFAVTAIQKMILETLEEPAAGDSRSWPSAGLQIPSGAVMTSSSSPRFRVYDTDFGFGRPSRVELVSMGGDGSTVLAEHREEQGGLQVSIALASSHMDEFAARFMGGLDE